MQTMPIAAGLAARSVRDACGPEARAEYVYDPLRLPRIPGVRRTRALAATLLRRGADAIAPAPSPRPVPRPA